VCREQTPADAPSGNRQNAPGAHSESLVQLVVQLPPVHT
jgi:hypothetical protein